MSVWRTLCMCVRRVTSLTCPCVEGVRKWICIMRQIKPHWVNIIRLHTVVHELKSVSRVHRCVFMKGYQKLCPKWLPSPNIVHYKLLYFSIVFYFYYSLLIILPLFWHTILRRPCCLYNKNKCIFDYRMLLFCSIHPAMFETQADVYLRSPDLITTNKWSPQDSPNPPLTFPLLFLLFFCPHHVGLKLVFVFSILFVMLCVYWLASSV